MPRLRIAEDIEPVQAVPADLLDPQSVVWATAEATRGWLERHNFVRRLRPFGEIDDMNSRQRYRHALNKWNVRQGGNIA